MPEFRNILLLGAYGYTGRLIAAEFSATSIAFSVAGRNIEKLSNLKSSCKNIKKVYSVNAESAPELHSVISGFDAVINCIGPFNIFGDKVISECIRSGICYIDICGEQNFVRNSLLNNQETALEHGTTIFHSVAFESALSDLAAKSLLPLNVDWKNISVVYFFERSRPSPGTRLSMATSPHFPVYIVEDHIVKESRIAAFAKSVIYSKRPEMDAALYAPYPDILFLSKHLSPSCSSTYLLTSQNNAKFAVDGNLQRQELGQILELSRKRVRSGPDEAERREQFFEIILYAEESEGRNHCISLSGKDMYGITASIIKIFLEHLIQIGKLSAGVFSPSEIDGSDRLFERIVKENNISVDKHCSFTLID